MRAHVLQGPDQPEGRRAAGSGLQDVKVETLPETSEEPQQVRWDYCWASVGPGSVGPGSVGPVGPGSVASVGPG